MIKQFKTPITQKIVEIGPGIKKDQIILATETSCDETACAIVLNGVNHLNAHVCANYIDSDLEPPFLCLLVSGGHTQLIKVDSYSEQKILGETLDDAVGETYDKVARLLGIPYPGGPNLDKLAKQGDKNKFKLPIAKVGEFDFSFSGLKTAMLRLIKELEQQYIDKHPDSKILIPVHDIAASFQETVSETLMKKVLKTAEKFGINTIVIAGGVAANSEIRRKMFELENNGFKVYAPLIKY